VRSPRCSELPVPEILAETLIKICGIARVEDAVAAVEAGAHVLGLNFWPGSPRYLQVMTAIEIADAVRGNVLLAGVFVDEPLAEIERTIEIVGLDLAQLHGDDPRATALALGDRAFPAIRFVPPSLPGAVADFPEAWGLLIEPRHLDDRPGGTGRAWEYSPLVTGRRWFLAGGLRPDNVAAAIRAARPSGVDVASGVESAPGIKDHELVRRFIAEVRDAS
jgi:phosphoribosylanthranilate isomerase